MSDSISRKRFISSSLMTAAGLSIIPGHVLGRGGNRIAPSDKLSIGFIGTGRISYGLSNNFLNLDEADVVAGCDVYQSKRERFAAHVEDTYEQMHGLRKSGFQIYHDYRELLERDDIDAVVVATPDHWHAKATIDAANAGKHVYCEKPLTHTVYEGRKVVEAVNDNGIVLQTGTMQRSWDHFRYACELIRNGYLGDIQKVIVSVGDPAVPCDLEGEPIPEDLDWDRWLGGAMVRPFNEILAPPADDSGWPMWRQYSEFGGGILSDWGAHMFDIVQWALGMDHTGPVELVPPKTPVPKRGLMMRYANGIEVYHYEFGRGHGIEFHGTEGTMQLARGFMETKPETIASAKIPSSGQKLYHSENHYKNWVDSIKNGTSPICDAETGHRSASVCNIANIAYWVGKDLRWDPDKERFDNNEANEYLTKEYREGYEV